MPTPDRPHTASRAGGERIARILLVDDVRHLVDLMKNYLKRTTCRLLTARHGAEALRISRKERPDLIFLGASLAESDGPAICRAMKSDPVLRVIPVVIVTGRERAGECREAGSDDLLFKPVTQDGFLAAVRRFVVLREREEDRIPISLRVELRARAVLHAAYTRDLSPHGLFLKSRRRLTPGTRVELAIHLERGRPPVALQGEVRRAVEPKPGTHLLAGIGIRFIETPPDMLQRLREFVAARRAAVETDAPEGASGAPETGTDDESFRRRGA